MPGSHVADDEPGPPVVWTPGQPDLEGAVVSRFLLWLRRERQLSFAGYDELWRWSIEDLEGFWAAVWQFFEVLQQVPIDQAVAAAAVDRPELLAWFAGQAWKR